jgi:hypothetical protein
MPSMPEVIHVTGVAWQLRDLSLTDEQVKGKLAGPGTDVQIDIESIGGGRTSLKYKLHELPQMPTPTKGIYIDNRFPCRKPELDCTGSPRSIVVTCPDWATIVLETKEKIYFYFPRVKIRG